MTVLRRVPTIVTPRAASKAQALTALQVAKAYHYPLNATGKGVRIGVIELGGAVSQADLTKALSKNGIKPAGSVAAVLVDGAKQKNDGANGATGEVMLDIEVIAEIAPGAEVRVYFAPNTDKGFYDAIAQAGQDGCSTISISWGGAESSWDVDTIHSFDALLQTLRAHGIIVFAAAGDTGSGDSASGSNVDFPASSPNVIGCGGTELAVDGSGERTSEVTWDINDRTSATGGGVSKVFPGRAVPDVAGNASPNSGYPITIGGTEYVIGGTSAVAPLYAALVALISEVGGGPLGTYTDLLNLLATNPEVCFDVTAGDNGAYRAGPGRDNVTGFGVVDGARLIDVLTSGRQVPAPVPTVPTTPAQPAQPPTGEPTEVSAEWGAVVAAQNNLSNALQAFGTKAGLL